MRIGEAELEAPPLQNEEGKFEEQEELPLPKTNANFEASLKQAAHNTNIHKLISTFDQNKQTDLLVPE